MLSLNARKRAFLVQKAPKSIRVTRSCIRPVGEGHLIFKYIEKNVGSKKLTNLGKNVSCVTGN